MDATTIFWLGLIGAVLGNVIGGYLSYCGGVQGAKQTANIIAIAETKKARKKIIYQLCYTLDAINTSNADAWVSADTFFLINEWLDDLILADFADNESDKITQFLQRWKDIQSDAQESKVGNHCIEIMSIKKRMNPLVEDIEKIIKKYKN